MIKRTLAAVPVVCLSMGLCLTANAQDAETPAPTDAIEPAAPTTGYYDDTGNWVPPKRDKHPIPITARRQPGRRSLSPPQNGPQARRTRCR